MLLPQMPFHRIHILLFVYSNTNCVGSNVYESTICVIWYFHMLYLYCASQFSIFDIKTMVMTSLTCTMLLNTFTIILLLTILIVRYMYIVHCTICNHILFFHWLPRNEMVNTKKFSLMKMLKILTTVGNGNQTAYEQRGTCDITVLNISQLYCG